MRNERVIAFGGERRLVLHVKPIMLGQVTDRSGSEQ